MLILLLACASGLPANPTRYPTDGNSSRVCDDEARVLCYREHRSTGIALSCLSGEPYDRVCRAGNAVEVKP